MPSTRDPLTYAIIGAAMEVHKYLGNRFLEAIYQEALAVGFNLRNAPYQREVDIPVFYKGQLLSPHYRVDFVCYDAIIVELKALDRLTGIQSAQVINYLKAANKHVGLLLNFGAASLEYKRLVN